MDRNEITMPMDVKLDINERKADTWQLRTWTRCSVKVEAIKCFPCYLKITFIRCDDRSVLETNGSGTIDQFSRNLVVKINIPGVTVQLATSRTKDHSYGLFWKNNRKQCTIFLALDTQVSCDRHMKWIRKSIKNLELHRREILETRRASRNTSLLDDSLASMSIADASMCSADPVTGFNDTQVIRDINDKLGPLPEVPDSSINWSRRISGFSGIYEEIADGESGPNKGSTRKSSRASVASGIYEVMRTPLDAVFEQSFDTPPPLPPPRSRANTDDGESFHRSYTNPETASFTKRGLFDNVFWRHKRSDSCGGNDAKPSGDTPQSCTTNLSGEYVVPPNRVHSNLTATNRRNSFSSPDLSTANHYENNFIIVTTPNRSSDSIDGFEAADTSDTNRRNVSEDILSTYNMSCNLSTVNLVGAKLNEKNDTCPLTHRNSRVIEDVSGYCAMAPVIHSAAVVNFQKSLDDMLIVCSTKQNKNHDTSSGYIEATINGKPKIAAAKTYDDDNMHSITVRRDYDDFLNETNDRSFAAKSNPNIVYTFSNSFQSTPPLDLVDDASPDISELNRNNSYRCIYSSPCTLPIDDKYPSYYPNHIGSGTIDKHIRTVAATVDKIGKKRTKHRHDNRVERVENVYVESPQKTPTKRRQSRSSTETTPATMRSPKNISLTIKSGGGTLTATTSSPLIGQSSNTTPRLYKKYATLARITPNRYGNAAAVGSIAEKTIGDSSGGRLKKSDIGNSLKRFASLPRFRKIDFSPLKMKLNSVLHRQNTDNI